MIPAPSRNRIDELSQEYLALKDRRAKADLEVRAIAREIEAKGALLLDLVERHGSAHAEKSKLLHGVGFEVMATFGQVVSIDGAAVEAFRAAAGDELKPAQFRQVFEQAISYRLLSSAAEFIRTNKLSRKLKALYAACQVVKDKSPTLTVREKNPAKASG